MWKLTLALSLASTTTFAAGLIQIPAGATPPPSAPKVNVPGTITNNPSPLSNIWSPPDCSQDMPKHLEGANQGAYEAFFNALINQANEEKIIAAVKKIPPVPGVRCLDHKDAYGFERVSEMEYRTNCFAGNGKNISHVAEFRMKVEYIPANCASQANIRQFFSVDNNRTRLAACNFYKNLYSGCNTMAFPQNTYNSVSGFTPITSEGVDKMLTSRPDLNKYVNGSSTPKKPAPVTPVYDEDERKVSKKKKYEPKDEDEIRWDAACTPTNPFCSSSGNAK